MMCKFFRLLMEPSIYGTLSWSKLPESTSRGSLLSLINPMEKGGTGRTKR